jgi:hypothetical protein
MDFEVFAIWAPPNCTPIFILKKNIKKGIGLKHFMFSCFDTFVFPGTTTFEEHVCSHNKHHNVHHHPLHTLVVVQNLPYDNKLAISFWLKK